MVKRGAELVSTGFIEPLYMFNGNMKKSERKEKEEKDKKKEKEKEKERDIVYLLG